MLGYFWNVVKKQRLPWIVKSCVQCTSVSGQLCALWLRIARRSMGAMSRSAAGTVTPRHQSHTHQTLHSGEKTVFTACSLPSPVPPSWDTANSRTAHCHPLSKQCTLQTLKRLLLTEHTAMLISPNCTLYKVLSVLHWAVWRWRQSPEGRVSSSLPPGQSTLNSERLFLFTWTGNILIPISLFNSWHQLHQLLLRQYEDGQRIMMTLRVVVWEGFSKITIIYEEV